MGKGILGFVVLAAAVLMGTPSEAGRAGSAWGRIRDVAMQWREAGRPVDAYNLVIGVRPAGDEELADREFVSGFLALRALGRSDLALRHFEAMAVLSPRLRSGARQEVSSTAGYYLARTLQAMGRGPEAWRAYQAAAVYRDTFYGLLAANQIKATDTAQQLAAVAPNYPKLDVKYFDPRTSPELINAIIKPESNFRANAVSPVGALGIMQLMPGTAAAAGRRAGIQVDMRAVALNPAYNVAIGSRHFGDLLTRYGNNIMLSAAAYNAGSEPVDGWIGRFGDPRGGATDPVDWVELIPFKETRNYVKRVVSSYVTYVSLARLPVASQ